MSKNTNRLKLINVSGERGEGQEDDIYYRGLKRTWLSVYRRSKFSTGLRAQNDAKYVWGLVNIDSFTPFQTKGSSVLTAQDTLEPVLNTT